MDAEKKKADALKEQSRLPAQERGDQRDALRVDATTASKTQRGKLILAAPGAPAPRRRPAQPILQKLGHLPGLGFGPPPRLDHFQSPLPLRPLAIVNFAQVQHMPLNRATAPDPSAFHQTLDSPVLLPLTAF